MGKYDAFDKVFYGGTRPTTGSKSTDKLQKTINNYKARIEASGGDSSTDDRNAVEKALNLRQNQGLLFDIFELLNRPQQAIFSGWKAAQEGKDFGEGAKQGITGNDDTQFKDILKGYGYGKNDRKGKIDLIDIAGFAGDVLLDPLDLALIPVTGGSNVAAKAVTKADDVIDTARAIGKAANAVDNVTDVAKAGEKSLKFVSASDILGDLASKGIKKGFKAGDNIIEKALTKADNTLGVTAKTGEKVLLDYGNKSAHLAGDLRKTITNASDLAADTLKEMPLGRLETYKTVKNQIENAFKTSQNTINAILSKRGADRQAYDAKIEIGQLGADIKKKIDDYAQATGKSAKEIDEGLSLLKESKMDRKVKFGDLLKEANEGSLRGNSKIKKVFEDFANNNIPENILKDNLSDFSVKINKDTGLLELGKGFNEKVLSGNGVELNKEVMDELVDYGNFYTKADKAQLKELKNLYKNDKAYKELYDSVDNVFNNANEIITKHFGTDIASKYADNNLGYVAQTLSDNNDIAYKSLNQKGLTNSKKTDLLKSRSGLGSMRERNEWYRNLPDKQESTLFNEAISDALTNKYIGKGGIVDKAAENLTKNEVLLKQTFGNLDAITAKQKEYTKAMKAGDKTKAENILNEISKLNEGTNIKILREGDNVVPVGYEKVKGEDFRKFLENSNILNQQLGGEKEYKKILKFMKDNDNIAINSDIVRMFNLTNAQPKELKGIQRLYSKWLEGYKKWKLVAPTYLANNFVGNTSNLYLSGISATDMAKFSPDAYKAATKGEQLYQMKLLGNKLSKSDEKIADLWGKFLDTGFGSSEITALVQDIPEDIRNLIAKGTKEDITSNWSKIKNYLPTLQAKGNETMDNVARLMVLMKSEADPKYLQKLGVENAQQAISKVMFDPAMLTETERKYMKNIVPFYTYAKNNIAYQLDNLGKNTSRYNKTMKGIRALQRGVTDDNEENLSDWVKNGMYIPVPGLGKDGNYVISRLKLPMADVFQWSEENPMQNATSVLNPLIKAPVELATGTNSFTGQPIESFPGQASTNIPFLTKKQEYLLSNISGFDVPLKTGSRIFNGISDTLNEGGNIFEGIGAGIGNTLSFKGNVDTDKISRQYEEIDKLQNLIKQYKQKGLKIGTMNELKQANKNGTNARINSVFAKYGIGEDNKQPWEK